MKLLKRLEVDKNLKQYLIAVIFILAIFSFGVSTTLTKGSDIKQRVITAYKNGRANSLSANQLLKGVINEFESSVNQNFYKRLAFVDIFGGFQRLLGKNVVNDADAVNSTVYKMKNGQLTLSSYPRDLTSTAKNVVALKILRKQIY